MELDITESLSPDERERFESRTGLVKAPVTLILPPEAGDSPKEALKECEIVMVFLHGLGGDDGPGASRLAQTIQKGWLLRCSTPFGTMAEKRWG